MEQNPISSRKFVKPELPIFCPDATRGVLRAVDTLDIKNTKTNGLVVNTYHLMFTPGIETIKKYGGVKNFMKWDGFTISDSGGFQMLSLVNKNKKFGQVLEEGVYLTNPGFTPFLFTPEMCIQTQFIIGSDLMIVLDDCPKIKASRQEISDAVDRTVRWAKRCKTEFNRLLELNGLDNTNRPMLFGVIQGGSYKDLRKRCADALLEIGFDGFGYGGWPMTRENVLDEEYLDYVARLVPNGMKRYALGVGLPHEVGKCVSLGYEIFDCVLPTRDARHKRLYIFNKDPEQITDIKEFTNRDFYSFMGIHKEMHAGLDEKIDPFCDCYTCTNYSKGYLRHLFAIKDTLAYRLASIHNMRMYSKLMENLKRL